MQSRAFHLKRANALFNFSFEKGLTNFNLYVIIKIQKRKGSTKYGRYQNLQLQNR